MANLERDRIKHDISPVIRDTLSTCYNWSERDIENFLTVITELTHNAFQHGCGDSETANISITVSVHHAGDTTTIKDPGPGFNLRDKLKEKETIQNNEVTGPFSTAGRGLLIASNLAILHSFNGGRTIQAMYNRKDLCELFGFEKTIIPIEENLVVELVTISGSLDATTTSEMRSIQSEIQYGITISDLSNLTVADSTGISFVVASATRHVMCGGLLVVTNLKSQPREIFKLLRLQRGIPIFPSNDSAIAFIEYCHEMGLSSAKMYNRWKTEMAGEWSL